MALPKTQDTRQTSRSDDPRQPEQWHGADTSPHLEPRYLVIGCVLTADGRLELQPGFSTAAPHFASMPVEKLEPSQILTIELLDERGEIILREHLAANPICYDPPGDTGKYLVVGKIGFSLDARQIRFSRHAGVILEMEIPRRPPRVELTWNPPRKVAGRHLITWRAEHPDGAVLHFAVQYFHAPAQKVPDPSARDQAWQPSSLVLTESQLEIDFDELPGGYARIRVLATDGFNTTAADSAVFHVVEKGCRPMILAPEDGASFAAGELVWMQGQAFDFERQCVEFATFTWESSLDGQLGNGPIIHQALSPGRHEITLRAGREPNGRETHVSIDVSSGGPALPLGSPECPDTPATPSHP